MIARYSFRALGHRRLMGAPGPRVGDPARLQFQHRQVRAGLIEDTQEGEAWQFGMKREIEKSDVLGVERENLADLCAQEGQVEVVASGEDDGVEIFVHEVVEGDALSVDGANPWLHR